MSTRTDQVGSVVHRAVQDVLKRGLSDPRVSGVLITVTGVTMSHDLRTATILVVMMPDEKSSLALHGLKAASRHIRHQAADAIGLKRTPEFVFKIDTGARKQANVLDALAKVRAERDESSNQQASTEQDDAGTEHNS